MPLRRPRKSLSFLLVLDAARYPDMLACGHQDQETPGMVIFDVTLVPF